MYRRSRCCNVLAFLPTLLVCLHAATDEECHRTACSLTDAIAQDNDEPLSLVQVRAVKAVAMRSNLSHQSNESLNNTSTSAREDVTVALSEASEMRIDSWGTETLRAFYIIVGLIILLVVLNFSLLYWQLQRQDKGKGQASPKISLPVDHLVLTSKLDAVMEPEKGPERHYTRVKEAGDEFAKGAAHFLSQALMRRPEELKIAERTVAEQAQKICSIGEPLDAKLVLPLRETWYAVAIEEVLRSDGHFEILRITGCPSLRANVHHGKGHDKSLELFCCNGGVNNLLARVAAKEEEPRIEGEVPAQADGCSDLCLCVEDANSRDLGTLRPISHHAFQLVCNKQVAVTLEVDDDGQLQVSGGGNQFACISCLAGHLGICINAGADTGLVICLVLAVVLLGDLAKHVLPKARIPLSYNCEEPSKEELSPEATA